VRTCTLNELEELAKQIKQMESDTDGFKKRISVVKQELQTERSEREQLQHRHVKMIKFAETKYAEMIFEGTTEIAKLKHENAELLAEGTRRIAELNQQNKDLIAEGTTRIGELNKQNAALIVEANAKFAELMQKITELESRNLCLQEQMQTQHTIDHTDITKMAGTIKELNAGLHQCYGERYKIWLTPTSRYVVNTLEPR
jgi:chromosome segregation ATPase